MAQSNSPCENFHMRSATLIGLALVVLGILALVYQGFTYTTHKRVLDVGPVQATKEEHKTIPLPPVLGAIALVGGIVLIARDRR
jgi:hypothetical protein